MPVKLDDLRGDSWHSITRAIAAGNYPSKDLVARALRRGESVPPEAQKFIATVIESKAKGPSGRRPYSLDDLHKLIDEVHWLIRLFKIEWEEIRRCDWYPEFADKYGRRKRSVAAVHFVIGKRRHITPESVGKLIQRAKKEARQKIG
jgi:hypothetical protein